MNVPFETARDIIQNEPFPYNSLDRLRLMQQPRGLYSMAPQTIPRAQGGGLSDLPVVRAGWGGFLRKIAPIALAIAAPFVAPAILGGLGFGSAALGTGAAGWLAAGSPLATGLMVGGGAGLGSLIAGAKPRDALKQALISGATAGLSKWALGPGTAATAGTKGTTTTTTTGLKPIPTGSARTFVQASQTPTNLAGGPSGSARGVGLAYNPSTGQLATSGQLPQQINLSGVTDPGQIGVEGMRGFVSPTAPVPHGSFTQFPTTAGTLPSPEVVAGGGVAPTAGPTTGWAGVKEGFGDLVQTAKTDPWGMGGKALLYSATQEDFPAKYAMEDLAKMSEEDKLAQLGWTKVDAGFGSQQIFKTNTGRTIPFNNAEEANRILNTALGNVSRVAMLPTYTYGTTPGMTSAISTKTGGQINRNEGGILGVARGPQFAAPEFSGQVPGQGHGMEDNVYMPIVDKQQGQQVATLAVSPTEYVVDSHTMAALGNGNPNEGAKVMDEKIKEIRQQAYGTKEQPNQIDGPRALESLTV